MALVEVRNKNRTRTKLSNTGLLEAVFPQAPALPAHPGGSYTDAGVEESMATLTNGIQDRNPDVAVNLDYGEAPNLADVKTGGAGLPGSPYTPAPGSPGAGSANPADIPEPPGDHPGVASGAGSTVSPLTTSGQIANQAGGGSKKNLSRGESGIMI